MKSFTCLITACLLLAINTAAQQRMGKFLTYGRENGLPRLAYHDVFETSNGYVWVSSNSGLFQFDGKRFRPFYSLYNDSNSPADNNIVDFEEDNAGNLWMAGFFSGLTKYNLKTGRFRQYKKLKTDQTSTFQIFDLHKDSEGVIWIATAGRGLAKYLPEKDTFQFYYPEPDKATDASRYGENFVSGIKEDMSDPGTLWVSSFGALYRFNKQSGVFTAYRFPGLLPGSYTHFLSLAQSHSKLFMGTWFEGLIEFDKETKQFIRIPYPMPGKSPYQYGALDLQVVNDSLVYLAAMNEGLLLYHTRGKTITAELQTKDIAHLNTEINIQRVSFTPRMGLVAGGNSILYQAHPSFDLYNRINTYALPKTYPKEYTGLAGLAHDKQNRGWWLSVSNYAGLVFYNEDFTERRLYPVKMSYQSLIGDVAVDGNGRVSTMDSKGLLYYFDDKQQRFNPDTVLERLVNPAQIPIRKLTTDAAGDLWLAGKTEAFCIDKTSRAVTRFVYPQAAIRAVTEKGIGFLSLATDSRNRAWMSTDIGLFRFDKQKKEVSFLCDSLGPGQKLANRLIKSLAIDSKDRIWLGYFNEGIQVIDPVAMRVLKSFTVKNGLPAMEINYLAAGPDNAVYACTHSGLAVYKEAIHSWQLINSQDGLKRDYLDVPVLVTDKNHLLLDQRDGFLLLDLDSLQKKKTDAAIPHLTSIRVNDKEWSNGLLPDYLDKLTLPSSTRDITLEFSVMNWLFPLRTQYYFRVDGVHKKEEWIQQDEARVSLTGLSSGSYTFRFYGITAEGMRSPERILQITIRPPFYKTVWFIALIVMLLAGALYGLYRYRIGQLKKFYRMRHSISRDLHDDIGATLSNINILNELARRHAGNEMKTKEYLEKSGEDIQRVSESLSDIVWNINPRYDELQSLFIRMRRYAADMLEGKNIGHEIFISPDAEKLQLPMDKRRNFYLIFKEAVNNLVKYSGATHAGVSLQTAGRQLVLEIKDNGAGFDSATVQRGNGLLNMEKRAAEMGAQFVLQTGPGLGTSIRLSLDIT